MHTDTYGILRQAARALRMPGAPTDARRIREQLRVAALIDRHIDAALRTGAAPAGAVSELVRLVSHARCVSCDGLMGVKDPTCREATHLDVLAILEHVRSQPAAETLKDGVSAETRSPWRAGGPMPPNGGGL